MIAGALTFKYPSKIQSKKKKSIENSFYYLSAKFKGYIPFYQAFFLNFKILNIFI